MLSVIFAKVIEQIKNGQSALARQTLSEISEKELRPRGRELYESLQRLLETQYHRHKLSALEHEINVALIDGVSIVTACMNRNGNLLRALPSWLRLDVNEIIIVDWGSVERVCDTLAEFDDSRIKVVRIDNVEDWCLTLAFNLGLRLASSDVVFKLDSDICVTQDFLQINKFSPGQFVRGNWKSAVEVGQDDQKYVNGSFGALKLDLAAVGFYNENIRTYGWDDSDLYDRLVASELAPQFLDPISLTHLEHDVSERLSNQQVARSSFLGRFPATEYHNIKNKFLCHSLPVWDGSRLQEYEVEEWGLQFIKLTMIGSPEDIPKDLLNTAKTRALKEMLGWLGSSGQSVLDACLEKDKIAYKLIEHYELGVPYALSQEFILGNGDAEVFWKPSYLSTGLHDERSQIFRSISRSSAGVVFEHLGQKNWILPSESEVGETGSTQNSGSLEQQQKAKFFVTSIFDEQLDKRQREYVDAIEKNLTLFDFIVLFYERDSGVMREKLDALELSSKIIWIDTGARPTFEFMFDTMNVLAPGGVVAVANADVCFESPLEILSDYDLNNTLVVVSRLDEGAAMRGEVDWIRLENGLPNTLSADAWIYRAPMQTRFKSDYGIGTFNCDSFMNFRAVNSGLTVINPCFDIRLNHLHDPEYNSSAEKERVQRDAIIETAQVESQSIGGGNPSRGIQWGRLSDLELQRKLLAREVIWTERNIEVVIDATEHNLPQVCLLALKLVELRQLHGIDDVSIWIGASKNISPESYELLMMLQGEFGANSFYINAASLSSVVEVPLTSLEAGDRLLQALKNDELSQGSSADAMEFMSTLDPFLSRGEIHTFAYHKLGTNDQLVSALLSSLPTETLERFASVLSDHPHFQENCSHLLTDLRHRVAVRSQRVVVPTEPITTLIASIFKSEKYMHGYLDNLACCLDSSNCTAILVDPASPENEQEITQDFLEKNSWLARKIQYVKLEHDPGLYECWNTAIRMATTEFVGNANTDDKRSPHQIAGLIDLLDSNKDLAGAAAALRVTFNSDHHWYDYEPGEIWFDWLDKSSYGYEDLFTTDNGVVKSTNFMHCAPIWRRELHDKFGFFDEDEYGTSADWAFWLKCGRAGERFAFDKEVMGAYFLNAKSHNRVHDVDGVRERKIIEDFIGINQATVLKQ